MRGGACQSINYSYGFGGLIDWSIFSKLFKIGMPIGLTHLAEAGLFYASSVMMGWLGVIALAAHGIALQISSVTFVVHLGLSLIHI